RETGSGRGNQDGNKAYILAAVHTQGLNLLDNLLVIGIIVIDLVDLVADGLELRDAGGASSCLIVPRIRVFGRLVRSHSGICELDEGGTRDSEISRVYAENLEITSLVATSWEIAR